jgi:lantibiotic biosynthesis protein
MIVSSGFFALRTPLLPFEEWTRWADALEASTEEPQHLEGAFASDRMRLRARLVEALARPEVRDALFIASPSTDAAFAQWLSAPESDYGQKLERTLVRYFSRMAARATPFGLFSGCSVGRVGPATRLLLEPRSHYRRHTRLDMDYLCKLTQALASEPSLARELRYRPSSSLYLAAGRWRYCEATLASDQRRYELVAVERSTHLDATLARASHGASARELAQAICDEDTEVTLDEASAFIDELVATQLLVSELAPAVTGDEPIHGLIDQLGAHAPAVCLARRLADVRDALASIDAAGLGVPAARYHDVARSLEGLPSAVALPRLFQVDMVKPAPEAVLGRAVVDELQEMVKTLQRISPGARRSPLEAFRDAFVARFEEQEVPLLLALDDEAGLGYGPAAEMSPLLDGIPFVEPTASSTPFEPRHGALLASLHGALARGEREIVLGEVELAQLANPNPPRLPGSFCVMATLAATSPRALADDDYRIFFEGVSPSVALLGRFCHADPDLHARVVAHLRVEEARTPDVVFAEIVHLPEGRIGNVICRPVLRDHEIAFLGRSGAAVDRQIDVDDLVISVGPGREIILRSRVLGKRVVPCLTNAHNFTARSIGAYRFLCALSRESVPVLGLDWGPLGDVAYRPRVRVGNVVLSRETWHLAKPELAALGRGAGLAQFRAVQELRARRGLPRHVAVVDGDNVLPVDFENVLTVDSFVHLVKGRAVVTLQELAPGADELCVEGPEGKFCHELLVPFHVRVDRPRISHVASPAPAVVRSFPPGSAWLYAKLYTGNATTDHVLRTLAPTITRTLDAGAADAWFFVRYGDPSWHVRLRMHGAPARLAAEALPAIHDATAALLADGRVWRLQLDTYEREIERYGGADGIVLAERWFDIDSRTALGILELLDGDGGTDARWRLALAGIDQLLDDLGLSFDAKRRVIRSARDGFAAEHRADASTLRALGDVYRKERVALEGLLVGNQDPEHPLAPGLALITAASPRVREVGDALQAAERAGRLTVSVEHLAATYMHMLVNRLLRSAARRHELVLYDLLDRMYTARTKRGSRG